MQTQATWQEVLTQLKPRIGESFLEKWFQSVRCIEFSEGDLVLWVPDTFHRDWIQDHFGKDLRDSIKSIGGNTPRIKFVVGDNGRMPEADQRPDLSQARDWPRSKPSIKPPTRSQSESVSCGLNQRYIFDNFVVGPSNEFAHAACKAVAEQEARNYNPLFIYGGVGLGKTHLLNAVGNHLMQANNGARVLCIQTENFVNEMIHGIRYEKMNEFRNKYRKQYNILLMDDVHVLAGKEQTQEEFFYTFNDLYSSGKKIIMTSDRFPKDMPELKERLRSRFESGIIVDIQPPEFETRLAILTGKAEEQGIDLPHEVAMFLAEKLTGSTRTLEGTLIRLGAFSSFAGQTIDIRMASDVLSAIHDEGDSLLTSDLIMKTVAEYFKIKVSDLKSKKRNRKYAYPRQLAMYLVREFLGLSYPEIGSCFGGKNHATVIHAYKKIVGCQEQSQETRLHIASIKRSLGVG